MPYPQRRAVIIRRRFLQEAQSPFGQHPKQNPTESKRITACGYHVFHQQPVFVKPPVPRQLYLPVGVNQFCRFTSLAWTRCWAALVR